MSRRLPKHLKSLRHLKKIRCNIMAIDDRVEGNVKSNFSSLLRSFKFHVALSAFILTDVTMIIVPIIFFTVREYFIILSLLFFIVAYVFNLLMFYRKFRTQPEEKAWLTSASFKELFKYFRE